MERELKRKKNPGLAIYHGLHREAIPASAQISTARNGVRARTGSGGALEALTIRLRFASLCVPQLARLVMQRCLKCNSERIVKGKITSARTRVEFSPEGQRVLFFSTSGGTDLTGDAFACLDCGLVAAATSAPELREYVKKHCRNEK